MRRFAPFLYVLLLVAAVPWYYPGDNHALLFGMPAWVVIAIVVSFLASCLTAYILRRPWPGESDMDDG
ncbi:MAG: hypothetical protein VX929_13765 [Pseudomonadota bacterium]|nr:hypothetical protein [Pseudomonadota bacterium]